MSNINLTLPDGKKIQLKQGETCMQATEKIGAGLAKAALAAKVDGILVDMDYVPKKDASFQVLTFKDEEGKKVFWHSTSHLMAAAVVKLYPKAKLTIGPPIADGFYYDIDMDPVSPDEFAKIEKKMQELAEQDLPCSHDVVSIAEAKKFYKDNEYKKEILDEIAAQGDKTVTIYHMGKEFSDLCRGPHIPHIRMINAFKILRAAGAYWRGDEKNKQLQRLYGVSFPDKKELKQHVHFLEEAKKRDHRKIGKHLGLFLFSEYVGSGMPLYTPKGAFIRSKIVEYSRALNRKIGFQEVHTPNFNKAELFKLSGHYDKFKDDMVQVKSHYSKEEFFMKPMNCPQHTQIYAAETRSYRDLPIRFSDFANLHRDEKPGELGGLARLRCFSQDDGHSFCRKDQIKQEFNNCLSVIQEALHTYGLHPLIRLSLRDPAEKEKYLGDDTLWNEAEATLRSLLQENKIDFKEELGEAAFYGPKMDIVAKDSLGREWQISTIQLDFNMPQRFGLKYQDEKGGESQPVMIHRAIVGSPERFMSILIEHYAGKFPLWLSPNQVKVIPVSEKSVGYAEKVRKQLFDHEVQVELDDRSETVNKKIREAQLQQCNYILVVGEKEEADGTVNVRTRDNVVHGEKKLAVFLKDLQKEIEGKK